MQRSTAQTTESKTKKVKAQKKPSASQRTVSLFTGRTDLEDPSSARDGTLAREKPRKPRIPNRRWVSTGQRDSWNLEEGSGERARQVATISRASDGTWSARVFWNSKRVAGLPSMAHAANVAEGSL